jgi:hypothetical protein
MKNVLAFCAAIAAVVFGFAARGGHTPVNAVDEVVARTVGVFTSAHQSQNDSDYANVVATTCRISVADATGVLAGAQVMYTEQAYAARLATPYRARVLAAVPGDAPDAVLVYNYLLNDPDAFAGLCDQADPVVTVADIGELKCTVRLEQQGAWYVGGPVGACPNASGADFTTHEYWMGAHGYKSWDRGWKADSTLLWGPAKGPYVMERVDNLDDLAVPEQRFAALEECDKVCRAACRRE